MPASRGTLQEIQAIAITCNFLSAASILSASAVPSDFRLASENVACGDHRLEATAQSHTFNRGECADFACRGRNCHCDPAAIEFANEIEDSPYRRDLELHAAKDFVLAPAIILEFLIVKMTKKMAKNLGSFPAI